MGELLGPADSSGNRSDLQPLDGGERLTQEDHDAGGFVGGIEVRGERVFGDRGHLAGLRSRAGLLRSARVDRG